MEYIALIIPLSIILLFLLIILFFVFVAAVGEHEKAVVKLFGKTVGVAGTGFYLRLPFIRSIVKTDMRDRRARAFSGDVFSFDKTKTSITAEISWRVSDIKKFSSKDNQMKSIVKAMEKRIKAIVPNYKYAYLSASIYDFEENIKNFAQSQGAQKGVEIINVKIRME